MAYHERVIGRMVSNLWFQVASTPPAAAGAGGGNVVGPLPSPPGLFGVPERVPELTFVVGAYPGDNGFIQSANEYHEAFGLDPQTFTSLESLVDVLRQPKRRGIISRLRSALI